MNEQLHPMYYTCLQVTCDTGYAEILMAEVAEAGFDTFLETESGFEAYAEREMFDRSMLDDIKERYGAGTTITFRFEQVEKKNWNEEWEKNYHPILVDDQCRIRAAFHQPDPDIPLEIVITPKMSFGTGHHQTTYLMVSTQLKMDHKGKRVMDAGCGTAVLSIVASKRGASEVEAFDIDEWSIINGNENAEVNNCGNIRIRQGTIDELEWDGMFDIVLANINKNVLLEESGSYQRFLNAGGHLLISGFYTTDIDELLAKLTPYGMREVRRSEREGWASLLLQKV